MTDNTSQNKDKYFSYETALLSYVPMIGFFFCFVLLRNAYSKRKGRKIIFFISAGGILCNILVISYLLYGLAHSDNFRNIWAGLLSFLIVPSFWIMLVISISIFYLPREKSISVKGLFFGLLIWSIILNLFHYEDNLRVFDILPGGERGMIVGGLLFFTAPIFMVAGLLTGMLIKKFFAVNQ
jgi:hypothetical protein